MFQGQGISAFMRSLFFYHRIWPTLLFDGSTKATILVKKSKIHSSYQKKQKLNLNQITPPRCICLDFIASACVRLFSAKNQGRKLLVVVKSNVGSKSKPGFWLAAWNQRPIRSLDSSLTKLFTWLQLKSFHPMFQFDFADFSPNIYFGANA